VILQLHLMPCPTWWCRG